MNIRQASARALAVPALAGVLLTATAAAASAHVTMSPSTGQAGAYTVLTFSVPHGCDGSATTKVAIRIPESVTTVTPTRNPFWKVEVATEKLAQPVTDSHGNSITERDGTVTYTAITPLPDKQRDTFELSLKLPDTAGATLAFPVVQTCQKGRTGWTEVAVNGQDADSLEHPAPTLTLTKSEAGDPGGHGSAAPSVAPAQPAAASGPDLGVYGLAAGVLGLAAGVAALVRQRHTS
ncbi:MAG: YcnI family protein [Micropruina sp.]|uniref:YcnI family copper-binding membrane protein n=1 Tax=Micropruina sp. TaxID=2737536 RepID=UPI0039E3DC53